MIRSRLSKKIIKAGTATVLALSLFFGTLFIGTPVDPSEGSANSSKLKKLEEEKKKLESQKKLAEAKQRELQKAQQNLKKEENKLEKEIAELDLKQINTEIAIEKKKGQIQETENLARKTAQELLEAEERIQARDELLKTRIRTMYEFGGQVSYLEVLFGASSISDFLNRIDFLSLVLQQDQKIIEDYVQDKEVIEAKKLELEQHLAKLEDQMAELNTMMAQYKEQEKKKSLRIAQISKEQEDLAAKEEEEARRAIAIANEISKKNKEIANLQFDGVFTWPVPGHTRITSQFGLRADPFTGQQKGHRGTDIGAPQGTNIVAASGGIVVTAEYLSGYGNTVIIEHGDGIRTLYGHIRNGGISVKVGDKVKKGQKIAEVGSTGRSTGPHLHFEVHKNGVQVDPMKYLKK